MKKVLFILLALAVVTISVDMLFAAGVIHNTNQSAEFIRMPSRNASTDLDAVFFNPAGTTALADGLHLYLSNQVILQTRTVEDSAVSPLTAKLDSEYEGTTDVYLFPNFYGVYKTGQLAAFFGFAPVGGGGTATFDKGLPAFFWLAAAKVGTQLVTGNALSTATNLLSINQEFEGSSTYLMGQVGAAYKINDMISVALGLRYLYAMEAYTGKVTPTYSTVGVGNVTATSEVDTELNGQSYGTVLGVNLVPMAGLNIGIRYEWYSELELEANTTKDDVGLYPDGEKFKKTPPQVIGLGIGYLIMPGLTTQISFTYALNEQVDHDGAEDEYQNSYEAGIGVEYVIMPGLRASVGYLFSQAGMKDTGNSETDYDLDSHTIGLGAGYTVMPGLELCLGFSYVLYKESEIDSQYTGTGVVTLGKTAWDIAIGVTYKAM